MRCPDTDVALGADKGALISEFYCRSQCDFQGYLVRLVRAAVEEGAEHVDGNDLDLIQHVSSILIKPLLCCDI